VADRPPALGPLAGYIAAMTNAFGVIFGDASVRRAAVEGVPTTVDQRHVSEIVAVC